jgi:hypothetical protein
MADIKEKIIELLNGLEYAVNHNQYKLVEERSTALNIEMNLLRLQLGITSRASLPPELARDRMIGIATFKKNSPSATQNIEKYSAEIPKLKELAIQWLQEQKI